MALEKLAGASGASVFEASSAGAFVLPLQEAPPLMSDPGAIEEFYWA